MIINGKSLADRWPVAPYAVRKHAANGVSYGLTEAGYDIRIKQSVRYRPWLFGLLPFVSINHGPWRLTRFALASTFERFAIPAYMVGVLHDKSTWARRGLSVFNTVLEPGWQGFLTLELVFHGRHAVDIKPGSGIGQVLWHELKHPACYVGKYQNQPDNPVPAINSVEH